jgi:hypothetical protein
MQDQNTTLLLRKWLRVILYVLQQSELLLLMLVQLRDCLAIPVPRIYAWSTDDSNATGAEYILEEKAEGQPLGSVWSQLSNDYKLSIVKQIVGIEKKLASVALPRHGCIYYQADLESRPQKPAFTSIPKQSNVLDGFAIGPLTHPKYWQGQRATMNLDRGPC